MTLIFVTNYNNGVTAVVTAGTSLCVQVIASAKVRMDGYMTTPACLLVSLCFTTSEQEVSMEHVRSQLLWHRVFKTTPHLTKPYEQPLLLGCVNSYFFFTFPSSNATHLHVTSNSTIWINIQAPPYILYRVCSIVVSIVSVYPNLHHQEVCGSMHQVKTSPFKLNLVARLVSVCTIFF